MSDNLKWFLLIPVVIVAIAMGFLVPKLLGGSGGEGDQAEAIRGGEQEGSQAMQVEIDDAKQKIDAYQDLVNRNPGDLDALRGLADNYYDLGTLQSEDNQQNEAYVSYKTAVDNYRKFLALQPDNPDVQVDIGLCYAYMEMAEVAERQLKAVTEAGPNWAAERCNVHDCQKTWQRALHSLGWVQWQRLGKVDEAKVALRKSYELNPDSPLGQESKRFLDELTQPQASAATAP